jgi:long-chain fatty acid transport protein
MTLPDLNPAFAAIALLAALALLGPRPAPAAALWIMENGGTDTGMAGAGRAALAADATTVAANPAGLARLDGTRVNVAVLPTKLDLQFDPDGAGPPVDGDRGSDPTLGSAFLSKRVGAVACGIGVHSYLGMGFDYGRGWSGHRTIEHARFRTTNVTPAVAWRLTDRLDVGVAADFQYADLSAAFGVSNDVAIYGPPAGLPDGRARLTGDSWALGGGAGLLYRPDGVTRLGLAWLAGPRHDIDTQVRLHGLHPVPAMLLAAAGPVRIEASIPQQVLASVVRQVTVEWQAAASVGWQDWSSFGEAQLHHSGTRAPLFPDGLDDTWHVALGTRVQVAPRWTLATGVAYDSDPTSGAAVPLYFPVSDQWRVALGVEFEPEPGLRLRLGYSQLRQGAHRVDANHHPLPLPGMVPLAGEIAPSRIHVVALSAAGAW